MNMGRECGGSEKQAKSTKHSMECLDRVRLSRAEVETEGRGGLQSRFGVVKLDLRDVARGERNK